MSSSETTPAPTLAQYPNIDDLLDVKCPVIAILAEKTMRMGAVMKLDIDSVIVFDKHNSDPITLCVNNITVGSGKTIKVGDHFGLHLRNYSQESAAQAVGAMGMMATQATR